MRLTPCQYCELELVLSQSKEHEEYCGTRTETCPHCKCNVMLRERAVHPVLCGSLTPPQERNNSRMSHSAVEPQTPEGWFEAHSIRNVIRAQERGLKNNNITAAEHQAFSRVFDPEVYNSATGPQGSGDWKNTSQRNTTFGHCEFIADLLIITFTSGSRVPNLIMYLQKWIHVALNNYNSNLNLPCGVL